jgi:TrmH family RNA methyltransferase
MTKTLTHSEPGHGRLRLVEGKHNSLVKELRRAFDRGELTDDGCFAIEGSKILEEAIRSSLKLKAVFCSASAENKGEKLLPQIGANVETLLLPDKLFATAVPSDTPQGVAALVRFKEFTGEEVMAKSAAGPLLVISGVQDPGNLGTILRSAEAFGAGGVLLGEGTVSPFNPRVVRGSAGSVFRLPFARVKLDATVNALRTTGVRLLATSSHKGTPIAQANLTGNVAIFIGSEGAGLSRDVIAKIDELLAIPHSPKIESLNAGVAASIILYEIARQRAKF